MSSLRRIKYVSNIPKYKKFARPNDILEIKVELLFQIESSFRFKAFIECHGDKIMSNEFTLVNITENNLKGVMS